MTRTDAFSEKAAKYDRFRWDYAAEGITFIKNEILPSGKLTIADVGSGTGILTGHFIDRAGTLYAVEPNDEMRRIAEGKYKERANFVSVARTSDNTGIADHEVDIIMAAHAVNWFAYLPTMTEFRRILAQNGKLVLVRNRLLPCDNDRLFAEVYLTEYGYRNINKGIPSRPEEEFFDPSKLKTRKFPISYDQNWDEFFGALESASYFPSEDAPLFERFKGKAEEIFRKTQADGVVHREAETAIYYGRLKEAV